MPKGPGLAYAQKLVSVSGKSVSDIPLNLGFSRDRQHRDKDPTLWQTVSPSYQHRAIIFMQNRSPRSSYLIHGPQFDASGHSFYSIDFGDFWIHSIRLHLQPSSLSPTFNQKQPRAKP